VVKAVLCSLYLDGEGDCLDKGEDRANELAGVILVVSVHITVWVCLAVVYRIDKCAVTPIDVAAESFDQFRGGSLTHR